MTDTAAPVPSLTGREKLRYGTEAAGFLLLMGIFRALGVDAASALGGFLGRQVFRRLSTTERARENLRAAFPEHSPADIDRILVEMWDNLGRTVAEYAHLDRMTLGPGGRIETVNTHLADAAMASGKGVMFISAHLANWEILPIAAHLHGYEAGMVYRPPNNPYVDRWIARQRARNGPSEQITKGARGTRRIFNLLRRGKAIMMLVDQKTEEGVPALFFGRDAMTTAAPASLALKLGAVLLPVSNERLKGARFRVTVQAPILFEPTGDAEADIRALTAKINQAIETSVRARPSQWLWIHRRWQTPRDALKVQKNLNA